MIGKTISHYKILDELGRGGMGVVYKAEDTKLHRTVALKFLPTEFTTDPDAKERFSHEAQAAAVLNHANICTVYEIDEYEGQSFIAMEYVEGESLKAMIDSGPLKLDDALDIAMQIVQGLVEAHEKDIVHRDVKPANIMVTGKGQVKIMDFGLAKLRNRTIMTKEGTTLGTVAYMSPEQAAGDRIDNRTDIWSLGVVIYEMVSGRRPFGGEYEQAVIYAVLNDEPEPLTAVRTGVPPELERIVNKCLERHPEERYQTARDLAADLRHLKRIISERITTSRAIRPDPSVRIPAAPAPVEPASSAPVEPASTKAPTPARRLGWLPWAAGIILIGIIAVLIVQRYAAGPGERQGGSGVPGLKMLVVLPFENLGPPGDEYFADGITDAITARLAGLSGIGVISRQSAIQYKERTKSTRQISEELGVDFILEGTIQRERPSSPDSRVRIIPQLIRSSDDIHVWAETYDEDMTEVFRLQSEIAERVARELDITLLGQERKALAAKPTENLEAYEYYLQGIEYSARRVNEEDSWKTLEMFQKAVELDPNFALAWVRLSRAHTWLYWRLSERDGIPKATTAVNEALRIDPDLLEAHLALGFIYYYGSRDYERALEQFYIVLKNRPSDEEAMKAIAFIKRRQGKCEEALTYLERALERDPRSYILNWDGFGNTYMMMRRFSDAERYVDRAISLAPDMPSSYISKAYIAIGRDGDRERARHFIIEAMDRLSPERRCSYMLWEDVMPLGRTCYDSPCEALDDWGIEDCTPSNIYESVKIKIEQAECLIGKTRVADATSILDSLRAELESLDNTKSRLYENSSSDLALVYALLGMKDEAIKAGIEAVEAIPISKDAFEGPYYVFALAEVYTIVGEYDKAIDQLELILSYPYGGNSVNSIRLDQMWEPLKGNPRFEKMMEKYADLGS